MDAKAETIIGKSAYAEAMRSRVNQVARYRYNVMITGPAGGGKRFLAHRIHEASPRAAAPFVPIDCSQLTEQVFAAQLFGHEAGAFAGAKAPGLGALRAAHGGTLFLGRIDALPAELQKTLLAVLHDNRVVPVGGRKPIEVEFRVLASTRVDLQKEVLDRRLIPELYTLLDEVSLRVEPLATRRDDVQPLADYFMQRVCEEFGIRPKRFLPETLKILNSYHWPGNVAELMEVIERAALAEESEIVLPEHLDF